VSNQSTARRDEQRIQTDQNRQQERKGGRCYDGASVGSTNATTSITAAAEFAAFAEHDEVPKLPAQTSFEQWR